MRSDDFANFFLATTSAGGAFIGLLFVALSIRPRRTFGSTAASVQHQRLAETTLLTLLNAFFVSAVALIPGVQVGWITAGLGALGVGIAVRLAQVLTRAEPPLPWLHRVRIASLSLVGVGLYGSEFLLGLRLLRQPADPPSLQQLALLIVGINALGLARSWILLGDPQRGWSGWLNPLQDRLLPADHAAPPVRVAIGASSGRRETRVDGEPAHRQRPQPRFEPVPRPRRICPVNASRAGPAATAFS